MTTHNLKKRNKKKRNIKRAARIKFELGLRNLKASSIASDLNISRAAVYRSMYGLSKITRVDEWIAKNLDMVI